ncbi:MAG: ABC transporter substrate binding protein [Bdellovibrionales bacterium]
MNLKLLSLFTIALNFSFPSFASNTIDKQVSGERLLFVHSYPSGHRRMLLNKGFKKAIKVRYPDSKIRFVNLDYGKLKHVFSPYNKNNLEKYSKEVSEERSRLHQHLADFKPTILVIADDEAGDVMHPLPSQFTGPIFLMGMNRPLSSISWYNKDPERYKGGIYDKKPVKEAFQLIQRVKPAKRVALITSDEMTSYSLIPYVKSQLAQTDAEIVEIVKSNKYSVWEKELPRLDKIADLVWILIPYNILDDSGNKVKLRTIGNLVRSKVSGITVGLSDISIKIGLLFAQASNSQFIGAQLGELVVKYLKDDKRFPVGFEKRFYYQFLVNPNVAKEKDIHIPNDIMSVLNLSFDEEIIENMGTI